MTFLLALIAVSLVGAGAVLLARAATTGRARVSGTMRSISSYGAAVQAALPTGPAAPPGTLLASLPDRVGRSVTYGALPAKTLRAAGMYSIPAERFQGYRVILTVGLPGLLLLMAALGGSASATTLLGPVAVGAIGWLLGPAVVRTRARQRLDSVDRALPQLIDVLTATVEAGLGFGGSLQLVAGRFDGPLGQELRGMLQEQSMGLSSEQALQNLLERCETPSVRAFVRAVTQGEALGVSIGQMLRNLAGEARKRRRQLAEEKMMKAPVKMLFPLVLLMLPAMFIVLMYPAVVNIINAFSH
jgi:tight adherence protein C